MKKRSEKQNKKIRNLVLFCSLCAILLSVSTYAWFIGMKTVNVAEFDVKIATTEGLFLSMDGADWKYELDAKNTAAYAGNANTWADGEGEGLIPMSSVGDMDEDSSRMKLYEKGSLTVSPGGYRLLASRVHNYDTLLAEGGTEYKEGKGYVAFDLFVKNVSGQEYYVENNPLNEEAIYLTTNSTVKVANAGVDGGVANTGIENSVRVAFVQLGRVKADTTEAANITGITCADKEAGEGQVQVTGICRDAQIWEPNDAKHEQNALNWYKTSCLQRKEDGTTVMDKASYGTEECTAITTTEAVPTYAISRRIDIADQVNIYDGTKFNSYVANSVDYKTYAQAEDKSTYKLVDFPYFTDTMKNIAGANRPQFMTLAPNSITKLRVYIYIEGQDIDNYDFASLGKKITVNFGFTKERYKESDYPDYNGPETGTDSEHTDNPTPVGP